MFKVNSVYYNVHLFDFLEMEVREIEFSFRSFSQEALEEMSITKGDLWKKMGLPEAGVDTAVPQDWLNQFVDDHCPPETKRGDYYNLVRSTTFMVYKKDAHIVSGCNEVQVVLNRIANRVAEEIIASKGITDLPVIEGYK